MVKEMLHLGNNGVMLSFNQSAEQPTVPGQWFASPKNDDLNLRPLLIINYKVRPPFESPYNYSLVEEKQRQMNMIKQMQQAAFNPPVIINIKEPVKVIPVKN